MESLIDRRCAGCVRDCNNEQYYKCAVVADYGFYEKNESAQNKPKYKAFSFTGRPSTVAKELNEFFAENPQVEIVNMVEVEDYAIEESGIVMIVKEN